MIAKSPIAILNLLLDLKPAVWHSSGTVTGSAMIEGIFI